MKSYITITLLLVSLVYGDFKNIDIIEHSREGDEIIAKVEMNVVKFDKEHSMAYGRIDNALLKEYPCLRILQPEWFLVQNRDISEDEYFSYYAESDFGFADESYERFKKYLKLYTKEKFKGSSLARKTGHIYLQGVSYFKVKGKTYCFVGYTYMKGSETSRFGCAGVLEDGIWKCLEKNPQVLDFKALPLGSVSMLKESYDNEQMYYNKLTRQLGASI